MSIDVRVATRKGLFGLRRENGTYRIQQAAFLGVNCTLSMTDRRDGTVYLALKHEHFGPKLHRSRDGGATFESCGTPSYPPMPDGYQPRMRPAEGEPAPWSLKLVWALAAADGDRAVGCIWAGTLPGGLFKSTDAGETWTLNRPLWDEPLREEWFGGGADWPGIHSISVHPHDHHRLALGVSCGGVWHTADNGATWRHHEGGMRAEFLPPERTFDANVQDPHRLVRCPTAPDRCWVQHHNGIFRSDDGGMNWQEIEHAGPSTFGFAVAVHPHAPDTAWFVPGVKDEQRIPVDGRLVVTRTRDGGESFDVLADGLPQEHAYDIVYRHALAVDDTGDRLIFGTTTGNLFVSEDGGDTWQCVSTTLPPIHAVEWVR